MGCAASTQDRVARITPQHSGPSSVTFSSMEPPAKVDKRLASLARHRASEKELKRVLALPVFRIPKAYTEDHCIEYVFFGVKESTCTEVTLFFYDKDLFDKACDRPCVTFQMVFNADKTAYTSISFYQCYDDKGTWDKSPSLAQIADSTSIKWDEFDMETPKNSPKRPVLYVSSARHTLSQHPGGFNNDEFATVRDYIAYSGNSQQSVEIIRKATEAAYPENKELPPLAQLIPVRSRKKEARAWAEPE